MSKRARRELYWGLGFTSLAVAGFVLLKVIPIIASFFISLTDWNVARSPEFIGLENYADMLISDPLFWKSMWVTAYYAIFAVPVSMAFAFALAMLLNTKIPALGIFRTLFYLPSIIPIIASSILWLWMFNPDFGLFNAGLEAVGLPRQRFIYEESQVIPSLVFMSMWSVGPMMIIFLAGLQDVPNQLYEAVEIDGGNALHKLWHVTIPMMTPTILFNLLISIITALQTFVQAFIMTEGGPNNGSLFIVYYIYRKAFQEQQMGYASALAWALFVVICVLSYLVFRTSSRWVFYHGGAD
ncbi:ABC transporter permease [Devosia pacifica]|uniref:ABC transporter permease n=1 Tax=Devosia pacifica TaxID=1335967 RepID=A0A918S7B2_9HYPH|nr:sugar ABC transporter permease [Devosia pacifica]GHA25179.1 ABC transporter permease [Devosia pacifica]